MPDKPAYVKWANGAAADALRVVAAIVERFRLALWSCIGWLDGGR